jgi:hypothetical protein
MSQEKNKPSGKPEVGIEKEKTFTRIDENVNKGEKSRQGDAPKTRIPIYEAPPMPKAPPKDEK